MLVLGMEGQQGTLARFLARARCRLMRSGVRSLHGKGVETNVVAKSAIARVFLLLAGGNYTRGQKTNPKTNVSPVEAVKQKVLSVYPSRVLSLSPLMGDVRLCECECVCVCGNGSCNCSGNRARESCFLLFLYVCYFLFCLLNFVGLSFFNVSPCE